MKIRQYISDGLNSLASVIAGVSTYLAATSPQPAAAAFPAAVTSTTVSGLYHPKGKLDPKTARFGLKGAIFAKVAIAAAAVVQGLGCGQYELLPSVAIPLGLSAGADANTYGQLKKLEDMV